MLRLNYWKVELVCLFGKVAVLGLSIDPAFVLNTELMLWEIRLLFCLVVVWCHVFLP